VKQKNRDCQQGGISLLKMRSSTPFVSRFDCLSRESNRLLAQGILKFLCTFCLSVECAATEALDGCQDRGFGPAERLGRGISDFDIGGDRGVEFDDGSMRPALDLPFGQERREEADAVPALPTRTASSR
jgi:hypothetical protein